MKCYKLNEQIVMPVFYHVDPSDTRKQTMSFKNSFANHGKENQEEVQKWKEDLTGASNLSGWDSSVIRPESKLVREIVENIWKKLMSQYMSSSSDFEALIGIYKRVERVLSLLCLDVVGVGIFGIWGMGGIGKTTIADAVFKLISDQFEGHCFIQNVREKSKDSVGLERLQREFFSELLDEDILKVGTPTIPPFIKERLNWKKVFIVLDDVNDSIQLETLVGGRGLNRFGLGSRIILTSRDRQVLHNCGVDHHNIIEIEGLNDDEALELFCNYAFKQKYPIEELVELSKRLVNYAGGNPLALKVLGSCLYGKDKQVWESALKELQATPNSQIFDVLKISFEGLEDKEKELFLDIACFFNGYAETYITDVLDCKYSLSVLNDKSLITIKHDPIYMHDLQVDPIKHGRIYMHELLVEMGWEIVRKESPKKPGDRSRLWKSEDVISTLKNGSGTYKVDGIFLWEASENIHLSCQVFDKMDNLRFLIFQTSIRKPTIKLHLPNGLNYLSNELRVLKWWGYPLKVLPSNFDPEKLVELYLSDSNIERLWEGSKAPKLKWLILNNCPHLYRNRILDVLDSPLLKWVDLGSCKSLLEFPSVQHLNNLHYLNLGGCINVTKFSLISENIEELYLSGTAIDEVPSSIQSLIKLKRLDLSKCTRLNNISTSIYKLKSLEFLHLNGCSELENFPEILETIEFLEYLNLDGTAIKELPPSIEHLNGLQQLHLSNCSKLEKLPEKLGNLKSLKELKVRRSAISELPTSITCLEKLEELDCSGCRGLTILPPLTGLCSLRILYSNDCNLMKIPEDIGCLSSLNHLKLCGNMFEGLPKSFKQLSNLRYLYLRGCNMLRSLTELPLGLHYLDAMNCKQLCQALPDAYEFVRIITNGGEEFTFIYANCLKLNHKAAGNVIGESLLLMQQNTNEESEKPPIHVKIIFLGSEIPEWFSYRNPGSSVNIQVLRHNLANRKYKGFAVCAVIGFDSEEYFIDEKGFSLIFYSYFETRDAGTEKNGVYNFYIRVNGNKQRVLDHIFLGYTLFSKLDYLKMEKLLANHNDHVNMSFEFKTTGLVKKVKYCAIHPIFEEPIKTFSGRRSRRCNDDEEVEVEVEPHLNKICRED